MVEVVNRMLCIMGNFSMPLLVTRPDKNISKSREVLNNTIIT